VQGGGKLAERGEGWLPNPPLDLAHERSIDLGGKGQRFLRNTCGRALLPQNTPKSLGYLIRPHRTETVLAQWL
jgi:hypothetical protein